MPMTSGGSLLPLLCRSMPRRAAGREPGDRRRGCGVTAAKMVAQSAAELAAADFDATGKPARYEDFRSTVHIDCLK